DDRVADLYDPYHPAVLRLIQFTIAAAWRANIPVSLCGEMAGDAKAAPLLLGLGLREFSMAPSRLPFVKKAMRDLDLADCIDLADRVMAQSDEGEIRKLLEARA
ncbi:MAG: phosphoenolpyruvate--protein phosphotransferase, partial [Proteobacteria bacterium]|nr:phosphoenolpyruvate--protein phosphotransferase [Pseudomonadota bacterium]